MKARYALALLVVLAACTDRAGETPPPPLPNEPPPQTVVYACDQDRPAEASYGADGALALTLGNETWPMQPAEAVSGARWTGETLEWWVTLEGGQEVATLRQLNAQRIGEAVLARCVRPTTGGVLAPEPPAATTPAVADAPAAPAATGEQPCAGPALSLHVVSADAAAGSRFNVLAFTNEGTSACILNGYPGVTMIGTNGQARAPFRIIQDPGLYYGESASIEPVRLQPSGSAYFDLVTTAVAGEVPGETEPCPAVVAVRASPPGDSGSVQTPLALNPCNQRARVTPFRPTETTTRGG